MAGEDSIFAKIIRKEIPSEFVHEDDQCVVIKDINAQAPFHFLILPKKAIQCLSEAEEADEQLLGHLLLVGKQVAKKLNLEGYRVVINNGAQGGQEVMYFHAHLLGGRQMNWPPG